MHMGSGGILPPEIRCSEIASEAILGQKLSRSSYMARGVLHPIFWLSIACGVADGDREYICQKSIQLI